MGFRALFLFLILILFPSLIVEKGWPGEQVAQPSFWVVGQKALPLSSLTPKQILHILKTDDRIWGNGDAIRVALLSNMVTGDDHWVQWLGVASIDTLLSEWIEADLVQDWPAPKRFDNLNTLLEFVARTPGAIGFSSTQPSTLPPNVRIIPIQEKALHSSS
ncbi:MAG TPA: hypothetical protein PKZ24_05805 [Nitrospirales bacterium]|nr:hypothetical protein [Nitrospirales bacterium]